MMTWTLNGRTWGYSQADVPGQPYFLMGNQLFKTWHLLMQDLAAECAGVSSDSGLAEAARVAAVAAQELAETARDAAVASATDAGGSATAAGGAASAAETARAAAVAAKNLAEAARDVAAASAADAGGSATAAGGSATAANDSAVAAAASKLAAAASAAAAALDRNAAQTAATNAINSAGAAAADRVTVAADKASVATALATAQALVGSAGTGTATGLVYAALTKSLATATDVVAVYLYETRRDSDGGAWTERVGGSWYLEALNSATRGATRRFPKMAGIVVRATSITIYDLHDLDASGVPKMWMVSSGTGAAIPMNGTTHAPTSVRALNGRLYVTIAGSAGFGVVTIDFVSDLITVRDAGTYSRRNANIAARNSAGVTQIITTAASALLVSTIANGVDCCVIPGGPVDSAGLPIPTVAVATASGVSVIHPNGAVYDITGAAFKAVSLTSSGRLLAMYDASSQIDVGRVPYADVARTSWRQYAYSATNFPVLAPATATATALTSQAIGYSDRLTLLSEDIGNPANGMVSYLAKDYATGWMPGDIRGAWLCDSATGSITGSTILDADFTTVAGWTLGTGWAHDAANGEVDASAAAPGALLQGPTLTGLVVGAAYLVTAVLSAYSAGSVGIGSGGSTAIAGAAAAGTFIGQFIATATSQSLFINPASTFTGSITSLSVRLSLPDRSYKGKGLIINGTLQRTALPCGLAAVTGYTAADYGWQPYNPDLDFGTGDFAVAFWSYCADVGASRCVVSRGQPSSMSSAGRWSVIHLAVSGDYAFAVGDGAGVKLISGGSVGGASTTWRHCVALRRSGVMELWVDGVRVATDTSTANVSTSAAILRVGVHPDGANPGFGVVASTPLVSAYAPTPAPIDKMYRDQRGLIVGGNPATLGGTSNSVTSLVINDFTGTLAVGTNDGVSVFAGLGRQYLDGASAGAAIANDAIVSVSASGPHLLIGTSAGAGLISDSVIARDRIGATSRPAPRLDEIKLSGVTTDASATLLTPLLWVGERETGVARLTLTARVYGPTATENGVWSLSARFSRDAGGSVAILTEADSQGAVRWDTGTPGAEPWTDKTSGAMALAIVTSGTEYIGAQFTGLGATRIELEGTLTWERIARDQRYVA